MSIKYASGTKVHSSPVDCTGDGLVFYTALRSALMAAGWSEVNSYGSGAGSELRSGRTPQGLQMVVDICHGPVKSQPSTWTVIYLKSPNRDFTSYQYLALMDTGTGLVDKFRVIANQYQFFTYNEGGEGGGHGAVICGGVPWLTPSISPFIITELLSSDPVTVELDRDHNILSGEYCFIDGVTEYEGLLGSHRVTVLGPRIISLETSGSGSYVPSSCVINSDTRISRCIWAQSMQYNPANYKAPTFRHGTHLISWSGLSYGLPRVNSIGLVNQYYWDIKQDLANAGFSAGSRLLYRLPGKYYDNSSPYYDAHLMLGEATPRSEPLLVGQLWDSFVVSDQNSSDVSPYESGGKSWKIYTVNDGAQQTPVSGSLVIQVPS